jgi:hypothetical protein
LRDNPEDPDGVNRNLIALGELNIDRVDDDNWKADIRRLQRHEAVTRLVGDVPSAAILRVLSREPRRANASSVAASPSRRAAPRSSHGERPQHRHGTIGAIVTFGVIRSKLLEC